MKYGFFDLKAIVICFLIILFQISLCYENYSNKYGLKTHEQLSSLVQSIKNFAKNLADTEKLQIKQSNLRFGNNHYQNPQANNIFSNENNSKNDQVLVGSILRDSKTGDLSFHRGYLDDITYHNTKRVLARARYNKTLNQIGWSKLFVETFDNAAPEIISWAAGFIEGKLTAPQILDFYNNLVELHQHESSYLNDVFKYYEKVEKFIRRKTNKESLENLKDLKTLEYWISVAMTQAQSDGLLQGFNSIMKSNIFNLSQIYFINADGEVPELINVFKYKSFDNNSSNYSFKEKSSKIKKNEIFSKAYLKEYYGSEDPEIVWHKIMSNSHCSAIIKLLKDDNDNLKDIFVGHTTWDSYSEMHRIFKKYSFSYTMYGIQKKNSEVMLSSYPGALTSTDDFYVLNKNIVVLETTLEMLDKTIYQRNMPDADSHVPNYIRISVANRLANSAKEWSEIFKQNNSGTYNSQWMIIDYGRFNSILKNRENSNKSLIKENGHSNQISNLYSSQIDSSQIIPNKSLFDSLKPSTQIDQKNNINIFSNNHNYNKNDYDSSYLNLGNNNLDLNFKQINNNNNNKEYNEVFYLLEQVPGYIEIKDMTSHLFDKGFWGSYNRPYFEKIYISSGYKEMMRRYGKTYSYFDNPRAKLINHEINKVKTIEDMKNLMQNNSSPFDGNYMNALSPRYDLVENHEIRRPSGGIDSKIVSGNLMSSGTVLAISGPSNQNDENPFNWNNWQDEPHHGLPEVWNFGWNYFDDNFIKN